MHEKEINRLLEEAKSIKEVRIILNEYEGEYDNFLRGLSLSIRYKKPLQKLIRVYPQYVETCEYYLNKKFAKRCLEMACKYRRYDIVKLMVARGAFISTKILCKSIKNKDTEIAKLLIDNNADIHDHNVLYTACDQNQIDIVQLLIQKGVNVVDKRYILTMPCMKGYIDIIKLLLKYINHECLCTAVIYNQFDVFYTLLKYSSILHIRDLFFTFMYFQDEQIEFVKLLLTYDNNICTEALQRVCIFGRIKIAKLLLENGADIHDKDDKALRESCREGHTEITKLLLENGADIHALNDMALWNASCRGHIEIVKLLLENGANVHAYNDILNDVYLRGHKEVAKLLIEYGANMCIFLPFANEKLTEQKTDL